MINHHHHHYLQNDQHQVLLSVVNKVDVKARHKIHQSRYFNSEVLVYRNDDGLMMMMMITIMTVMMTIMILMTMIMMTLMTIITRFTKEDTSTRRYCKPISQDDVYCMFNSVYNVSNQATATFSVEYGLQADLMVVLEIEDETRVETFEVENGDA